jgi:hypothetical protein
MDTRFTQSARKHRIGKTRALYVMNHYMPINIQSDAETKEKLLWIGQDERGLELEIVAILLDNYLLVIHVMPTIFRKVEKQWHLKQK